MKNISSEKEFLDLYKDFLQIGDFENAKALADECNNQYIVLKQRREEEDARKAEEVDRKARNKKIRKIIIKTAIIITIIVILVSLIIYNRQENSITIPDTVTIIKEGEYSRKQLINAYIPDGITAIGNKAFRKNKLTSIEIPDSVTSIGDNAFSGNLLTSINIGSNVKLGNEAFGSGFEDFYNNNDMGSGTYKRQDIKSNEWSVWDGNFRYENRGGSIFITDFNGNSGEAVIPEEINGKPVTSIGEQAFKSKNLTSITIPGSVITVENNAFCENKLTSVNISNGVTSIGDAAFYKNKLTAVTIPNSVTSIGINAFADNLITSIRLGANVKLDEEPGQNGAGVLGIRTGFNTAYVNNNRRAGTYTRPNINSRTWTHR
jgi:hypothetical protein